MNIYSLIRPYVWKHQPFETGSHFKTAGIDRYILAHSSATPPDSDINQTAGSGGQLSMWENRCMHATVSVACRPAETCRWRSEIGSVHRSILVGHRWPNQHQRINILEAFDSITINNILHASDSREKLSGKVWTICNEIFKRNKSCIWQDVSLCL